jgi:hypothetical protein
MFEDMNLEGLFSAKPLRFFRAEAGFSGAFFGHESSTNNIIAIILRRFELKNAFFGGK